MKLVVGRLYIVISVSIVAILASATYYVNQYQLVEDSAELVQGCATEDGTYHGGLGSCEARDLAHNPLQKTNRKNSPAISGERRNTNSVQHQMQEIEQDTEELSVKLNFDEWLDQLSDEQLRSACVERKGY